MKTLHLRVLGAATTARIASEGAALAIVLRAGEGDRRIELAGLLIACMTFPQVCSGPVAGMLLDRARRPERLVAWSALATALAFAVLAFGGRSVAPSYVAAFALAMTQPVLTGGLSALFTTWDVIDVGGLSAWDGTGYNIAGVGAPAMVTVLAASVDASAALWFLGACTLPAIAFVWRPPQDATREGHDRFPSLRRTVSAIWSDRPLRAVTVGTTVNHIGAGALAIAIASAVVARGRAVTDAGLIFTVMGIAALAGSTVLTQIRPRIEPARLVIAAMVLTGIATVALSVSTWPIMLVIAVLIGLLDGPILIGTYRARSRGAPAELRASVFTVAASFKLAASSIGAVLAGFMLAGSATTHGLTAVGITTLVGSGIAVLVAHP